MDGQSESAGNNSSWFTVYVISLQALDGRSWIAKKRYSDVSCFAHGSAAKPSHPSAQGSTLPPALFRSILDDSPCTSFLLSLSISSSPQFHSLFQKLKSRPEMKGVTFPGKSLGRLTLAQQEKRRDALDRFMIDVTGKLRLSEGTMAELNSFLDVHKHPPGSGAS